MSKKVKVCLVCSSGGHLLSLYSLKDFWGKYERFWVTFPRKDTNSILIDERI